MYSTGEYHTPVPPTNYYAFHNATTAANVSTTVVHALADLMDMDVTDTEFVLYNAIDPDALDRIFSPAGTGGHSTGGHVAFTVSGYRITVYSNGQIVITPPTI